MKRYAAMFLALLGSLTGCHGLGGVKLSEVATATALPSNVASVVTVTRGDQPVKGLRSTAFSISENEQLLDSERIGLRLIDPTRSITFHTVLLVDLGHAWSSSGQQQLRGAIRMFVEKLQPRQSVSVIGFDGSKRSRLLAEFARTSSGPNDDAIEQLKLATVDPSRNLRGGVSDALLSLGTHMKQGGTRPKVGTLVVFSRGPDIAGRVSVSSFEEQLSQSAHRIVFVGIAGDKDEAETRRLSKYVRVEAQGNQDLPNAFRDAADRVIEYNDSYYVVSYCSPGREPQRRVRIEVQVVDDELDVDRSSFVTTLDASRFGAGCNSARVPDFTTKSK